MQKVFVLLFLSFMVTQGVLAQSPSEEKLKEKYEKEVKEKQDEMITQFVDDLETNDFIKQIVTQKLYSYIDEKKLIVAQQIPTYQKQDLIHKLNEAHFSELKPIASEEVMTEINKFITETAEYTREKKKKNKKKRKKEEDLTSDNQGL